MIYCSRPFKSIDYMNKVIINNLNEDVKEEDTLIVAGDITMKGPDFVHPLRRLLSRIKCKKKILVLGNHDTLHALDYVHKIGFWSVHTSLELETKDILVVHDPALSIIAKQRLFVGGHVHDMFKVCKNFINVGVDVWNFRPVPLEKIEEIRKDLLKKGVIKRTPV